MYPSCPIELWNWSRAQMYCMVQLACLYIHALFNRHHKRFDSDWMAPHTQKSTTLDLIPWFTSPVLQRLKLWVEKTILSDRNVSFVFSPILPALEWRESWRQFSGVLAVPHCMLEHSTLSTSQHFHSNMDGTHFWCLDMVVPCWWCLSDAPSSGIVRMFLGSWQLAFSTSGAPTTCQLSTSSLKQTEFSLSHHVLSAHCGEVF